MLVLIFSLDYEVYGNGEGDFEKLILEPTNQLLLLFNKYGAKLTIMAEVAEILTLNKYEKFKPVVKSINNQLKLALSKGHDVQLHIHPQWFNAKYKKGKWILDHNEYSLAHLSKEKISRYIKIGKDYLVKIGKEVRDNYECVAFRAGSWLMQPSKNIVESLEEAGFLYDTSVFKWGRKETKLSSLDYTTAYSNLFHWRIDPLDINKRANREGLYEIPIFSRKVFITSMLSSKRLELIKKSKAHSFFENKEMNIAGTSFINKLRCRIGQLRFFYSKKFDFCRMTFKELKAYIDFVIKKCSDSHNLIPVVLIGHSKEFVNDGTLDRFFEYINSQYKNNFIYATFAELKTSI